MPANYFNINDYLFVGLGFRPMPPYEDVESTLIWYKGTRRDNYRHWVESLEKFVEGEFP